jgi:hypothetical protein
MRSVLRRSLPVEQPPAPLSGYKLAYPFLSADDMRTGFGGLSIGGQRVYGPVAEASCVWSRRHAPPRRTCSCGFYCFHSLDRARAMACETRYRPAVVLQVAVTGSFIRYEDGLRYGRQRVCQVRVGRCRCGQPATMLVHSGAGLAGWRQLEPACAGCTGWAAALTFPAFAARIGGPVTVVSDSDPAPMPVRLQDRREVPQPVTVGSGDGPSLAVVSAEISLLQARLDELQLQVERISGGEPPTG